MFASGEKAASSPFDSTQYFSSEIDNGNSGATDTIDWTVGNKQKSTLTANCTYTFSPEPAGPCNLTLRLVQDVTGGRTAVWPANVIWPGGVTPTLNTAGDAVDVAHFYFDGTDFYGWLLHEAASGGGGGFESYAKALCRGSENRASSTWQKLLFESTIYDNLNEVDTVTNYRWTAAADGKYLITLMATILNLSGADDKGVIVAIYKNGSINRGEFSPAGQFAGTITGLGNSSAAMITTTLNLSAGDYIEGYLWHNHGSDLTVSGANNYCTFQRIA